MTPDPRSVGAADQYLAQEAQDSLIGPVVLLAP